MSQGTTRVGDFILWFLKQKSGDIESTKNNRIYETDIFIIIISRTCYLLHEHLLDKDD